jgi:hypothetical protein
MISHERLQIDRSSLTSSQTESRMTSDDLDCGDHLVDDSLNKEYIKSGNRNKIKHQT